MIVNNSIGDKQIWKETLKDELSLNFNEGQRSVLVEEYLNKGLMTKIHHKYRNLSEKLKNFDFLNDDIHVRAFTEIQKTTDDLEKLTKEFEEEKQRRIEEVNEMESQSISRSKNQTDMQLTSFVTQEQLTNFMNYSYYYKVGGMKKLQDAFETMAERFFLYQKGCSALNPYLGPEYLGNYELFFNCVKQVVEIYKDQLDFNYIKVEKKKQEMIDIESDEEEAKELESILTNNIEKRKEKEKNLVSKMEKTMYFQLMNSIPGDQRYLLSFLLGSIYHFEECHSTSQMKLLIDNLRIFLYSERLMPKEKRRILFSNNKLYKKYNLLFNKVKKYYSYASSNMPELMSFDFNFNVREKELEELQLRLEQGESMDKSVKFKSENSIKIPKVNFSLINKHLAYSASPRGRGKKKPKGVQMVPIKKFVPLSERKKRSNPEIPKKMPKLRKSFVTGHSKLGVNLRLQAIRLNAQIETNARKSKNC
jgi:hypothetical protein